MGSDPISRFSKTVTFHRFEPGTMVKGRWTPGEEILGEDDAPLTAQMVIQPLKPSDSALLPEGERISDWRRIWSKTQLLVSNQEDRITGDVVDHGGQKWVVSMQEDWSEFAFQHFKFLARLVERDVKEG
jgi:hypothetical protein